MDIDRKTARDGSAHGRFETLIKSFGVVDVKALPGEEEEEPRSLRGVLIEGFASTPDIDRGDDIVLPQAFNKTLGMYMTNPVLLWDHGQDPEMGYKPIGQVTSTEVLDRGLLIKAVITNEDIGGMVQRGELRTMSFGYEVPAGGVDFVDVDGKKVRLIKELELYEISVVAIPMNPNARFSLSKSLKAYFARTKAVDESPATSNALPDAVPSTVPVLTPSPMDNTEVKAEEVTEEVAPVAETPAPEAPVADPAPVVEEEAVEEVKSAEETPLADTPAPEAAEEQKAAEETPATAPAVEEKAADETPTAEVEAAPAVEAEVKSVTVPEVPAEVKSLEAKAAALEARAAAAEEKVNALTADLKKADDTLSLLTDRFLAVEAAVKRTPTNQPLAVVSPFQAEQKRADGDFFSKLRLVSQ